MDFAFSDPRILTPELKKVLKPSQTAIIAIDLQGAYCDPSELLPTLLNSDTDELQEVVTKLKSFIDKARVAGVTIVWTKMTEHPDHVPQNIKFKMKIDGVPPISTPETPGHEYYKVQPMEEDIEIVKTHYNAFEGTTLDQQLKERGIKTVILTGGYASRCVAATAWGAADSRDYNLFVPSDLVDGPRVFEQETESMLSVVDGVIGFVLPSNEIEEAWV